MSKKFQKKVEDFVCEHCGGEVKGNGFTNHCPQCLWSKHVDVNPGDRLEPCGGMMEPVNVETQKGKYFLFHHCAICGTERKNRVEAGDDFDKVIEVSKKHAAKFKV